MERSDVCIRVDRQDRHRPPASPPSPDARSPLEGSSTMSTSRHDVYDDAALVEWGVGLENLRASMAGTVFRDDQT